MDYTKNNNSVIISKLAKRSLKENKGRNIAATATIAISVCLVLSLLLIALSITQINYNSVKDTYQATIRNVDEIDIPNFEGDSRLQRVGASSLIDYVQIQDGNIFFIYYSDAMIEMLSSIDGAAPKNEDEILLSQSYLDMTCQNAGIGDTITLETGLNIKGSFKITGITDNTELQSSTAYVFFSKSFLLKNMGDDIKYNAYLWLDDVHSYTVTEAQQRLTQACADYEIGAEQISFNSQYFRYAGQFIDSENLLAILLIGSLILFAAAIVVYTIFYISVGNKIREYGQLRTLGATKKQIKEIVIREGVTLAAIGSIAGVLLGCIIGYVLQPGGWNWTNTCLAVLGVILFEIVVVWLSIRTPAKLAGSAPPIEAGRYLTYSTGEITRRMKAKYTKSTPMRIALLNVIRSPKKAVLTMVSLGLCGVLFIGASSLQINITAEKEVRYEQFQYGNYKVEVIGGENDSFSEVQQLHNPLNEEMRQQILAIEGVKNIHEWKMVSGTMNYNNNILDNRMNIYGYAPQDEEKLTGILLEGTADYDELTQNNGLIVCSPSRIKELYGWEPHLGDVVKFTTLAGNGEYVDVTLTVMCITAKKDNFQGSLMLSNGTLQQITGTECTDSWEVITNISDDEAIEQQLTVMLQDNPHIRLQTYSATVDERQAEFNAGWGMLFILALLLGVFGVINLINTNATSLFSRKQEMGILQAIGMTGKQVRISLMSEGFINTLAATLITAVVGFPVGYMACFLVNETLTATYSLPWQAALMYFTVLMIIQLFLTVYDVWLISKTPVIERVNVVA